MSLMAQEQGIFVLPVISPAVPPGTSRLRTTVTAGHTQAQIEQAMNVLEGIAKKVGVLK
jgi:7-keto-8-aminopelargonate synthetase-like enzyme